MLELEGFGKATNVSLSLEVPWEVQKCSPACVFHLLFQLTALWQSLQRVL